MYRKIRQYRKILMRIWKSKCIPLYIKKHIATKILNHVQEIYSEYQDNRNNEYLYGYYDDFCNFYIDAIYNMKNLHDDPKNSIVADYANLGIYLYYDLSDTISYDITISEYDTIRYTRYMADHEPVHHSNAGEGAIEWVNSGLDKSINARMKTFVNVYMSHELI